MRKSRINPQVFLLAFVLIGLCTASQALALDISNGLVGWWRLDEGSGSSTADSSGNGNTGTLISSPSWVSGKRRGALQFSASGGYVQITDAASLKISSSITITAWIYPTACNASGGMIAQKRSLVAVPGDYNYGFWLEGSCRQFFQFYDSSYRNYTDTQVIPLNRWSFVAVTINESASKIQFYYNGIATSSPAYAGTMPSSGTAVVQIGRYAVVAGNYGFIGNIDDVRIYNRALTAAEIAILAKNGIQIKNAVINNAQL